ncbi:Rpp14/Pop5 family-domain-containing protein [Hygrophoropsis aurantiaca]|uniref:Rpp14/Pop5 family-domain-containing protein n=1 Tax=Hygrophoropsis aurantiaca TaxID=72124 RepID=A0ACB8AEL1_9AGAM|nr:Rpp14/Pop5 family-domain-containing protein [Hygrophoropsis aurantiaca]
MNRWILVEFIYPSETPYTTPISTRQVHGNLDGKQIYNTLKQSIIHNFGDTGWGAVATSLNVKYFSPTTGVAIIRVARDHHRIAWGGVTLLTAVDGKKILPNVVHISGTIKHAQVAAIQHNRQVIARFRARSKTPALYQDSYEEFLARSTQEIESLVD